MAVAETVKPVGYVEAKTTPSLLLRNYQQWPDRVAMRKKRLGIWEEYTWKDIYQRAKHYSLGLIAVGLEAGDAVAMAGDNQPQYFWVELAVQAAGATACGLFADALPAELRHLVHSTACTIVVAQDQEQVDKLLQIKHELPLVRKVIYWDPKGLRGYTDPVLMSLDEVAELGRQYDATHPGEFEQRIAAVREDDIAVICFTSGTSGLPKGACESHGWLIDTTQRILPLTGARQGDEYLSFTLPGWIVEQSYGLATTLLVGQRMNFPESQETVQENMREISPDTLMLPSSLWTSISSSMQVGISETTRLKRLVYRLFLPVGYRIADLRQENREPGLLWKLLYALGNALVFRPLKDKHGLHHVRRPITSGALIGRDTYRFFHAIGLRLRNMYGATEAGTITGQFGDDLRPDTVGKPAEGVRVKISEEGEILVASATCCSGYLNNPEATGQSFRDGWYHTGDAGYINDQGDLIVIDRLKDLKQLKDGTKFSPQYTESSLKFSPYVKEALVVENSDETAVAAIISIDFPNVGHWAQSKRITYTTFADLSQRPEVCALLREEVRRVNRTLPPSAQIGQFFSLHKEFDADEAELTRTKKLRRGFMEQRYADLIRAVFSGQSEVSVDMPVVYQDGRTATVRTAVKVSIA